MRLGIRNGSIQDKLAEILFGPFASEPMMLLGARVEPPPQSFVLFVAFIERQSR